MQKYDNLELAILSCLLQRPELMKETKLESKHFKKHYKIWNFLEAFYKKFGNFDLTLMMAISKNKYRMIEYIMWLLDKEPAPSLFKVYEEQLLKEFDGFEKQNWIKDKCYELANDFYVGALSGEDFKKQVDEVYKKANEIFGGE